MARVHSQPLRGSMDHGRRTFWFYMQMDGTSPENERTNITPTGEQAQRNAQVPDSSEAPPLAAE